MRGEELTAFRCLLFCALISISAIYGCFVKRDCVKSADCPTGQLCHIAQGSYEGVCRDICDVNTDSEAGTMPKQVNHAYEEADCRSDGDCGSGFDCIKGNCVSRTPITCPEGMAPIEHRFCIDKYEASRPDATAGSEGIDNAMATSRPGVMPWRVESNATAAAACRAAGKSLCTENQWFTACRGASKTAYSYGDEYNPSSCNGIDTYCFCAPGRICGNRKPCPYPYCYDACGADFHLESTGHFPTCTNDYGVFDMNGNLWEHVLNGDETRVRGGAFNCGDSKTLHRCDYIPGDWAPSAQGFRCCAAGLDEPHRDDE
jgi:formylglycine-generating enzyme